MVNILVFNVRVGYASKVELKGDFLAKIGKLEEVL